MKLTGELKDKVDQTANLEEAKDVIAQAGMLLTDDEVSEATGGVGRDDEPVLLASARMNATPQGSGERLEMLDDLDELSAQLIGAHPVRVMEPGNTTFSRPKKEER